MQLKKVILTIILYQIFGILVFHPVKAQPRILTLEEAIQTALENNRSIKIDIMNVDKANAAVDEAFGYALPSLDVSANFSHFIKKPKVPFPDFEALLGNATYDILFDENVIPRDDDKYKPVNTVLQSFVQANNFETQAQITQILFNSAVFRGIGASKIYLDLSKVQLKGTVSNTILNVTEGFYAVLLTKELLDIIEVSLINAEENLRNVKANREQGFTSEYDELQVEVRVENIRPQVLELGNFLDNAKNGLKILLGIEQSEDIDVIGEFNYVPEILPDQNELVEAALISNFNIKSMEIKKSVDEEFIELDRSEYWPTIIAFGNYTLAGSSDKWDFQNYTSGIVGLNFSLNLFKGGQVSNRVQQSTIAVMKTDEQIKLLRDLISTRVKSTIMELEKVKSQLGALERNVQLAQKAYDISTIRYKEGTGTQLEIKNADVELLTAKSNRLKSIHDYIIAKAELEQLLGRLDEKYQNFISGELDK